MIVMRLLKNAMHSWKKRIVFAVTTILLLTDGIWGTAPIQADTAKVSHGSSDTVITQEMLTEDISADYAINSKTQGIGKDGKYNDWFLKDSLQTISIEIDENNLNYLFQNAMEKPTVMARKVTIGDSAVEYVGLKTKGSYTLEHSFKDNKKSDRFSLTLNFGKYIKKKQYGEKQNFFGVEKISLNNFFFDKSMMKEYCSLAIMTQMGIPTPQYGLAKLYINGEYYGIYSMIEALDSPILEQYYGCTKDAVSDYLCKPEGTDFVYDKLAEDMSPMWEMDDDTYDKVCDMLPTVEEWLKKLNLLSNGKDFEGNKLDVNSEQYIGLLDQVIDVDEYLRYFAAHSFLCQLDNMFVGQKNFGLYVDRNGRSLLIPWDYDLSFGTYSPVTAEATANYKLDLMYIPEWGSTGSKSQLRKFYKGYPLFNVIFNNDELMKRYHTYMLDCAKIAALGGTTSFGKKCEPNFLNDMIKVLTEPLTQAAEEKTTERATYMNGIVQPRDLEAGLKNIGRIVAMRAVGVYCQINDIDTTVSGRGCNLFAVGNGQPNDKPKENGSITAVNEEFGFFTSAKYRGAAPLLRVNKIEREDEQYTQISEALKEIGCTTVNCYNVEDQAVKLVKSSYRLHMPVNPEVMNDKWHVYSYTEGTLTELAADVDDNILIIDTELPGIFVVGAEKSCKMFIILVTAGIMFLALAVTAVAVIRHKRK